MNSYLLWLIRKINNRIRHDYRRMKNSRSRYAFLDCANGWKKCSDIQIGDRITGSVFDPFVRKTTKGYEIYVSYRKSGTIVKHTSADGLTWSDGVVLLHGRDQSSWEEIVNRACVMKHDGKFYMWYTGQNKQASAIGLALSEDGNYFERFADNPVILADSRYEKQNVMNPFVLWDQKDRLFKMWYAAGEKVEPDTICYATSKDGIHWMKSNDNPVFQKSDNEYDKCKVGGCHIFQENGFYYMFYIGYQNIDNARICIARSVDGIHDWERSHLNPILSPTKNSWDGDAVYKPSVCQADMGGKYLLWYNGRRKVNEYIGLAIYSGNLDELFKRK